MIFEENIKIKYSEMDCCMALKPSSLLNFFQDIASENAQNLGFGYSYTAERNLGWFLLKYRIEFTNYPVSVYDLTIKTEPRGCNKLFAYRDFWVYNGVNLLGRASSIWSLVDMNSKAPVSVEKTLNNKYMSSFVKRDDDFIFQKIKPSLNIDISKTFDIRYEDIDVNLHANNGSYIIWALEPLDYNFRFERKIKTLDIHFKKEAKYGTKILSLVDCKDNLTTSHIIKNADTLEDLCYLEVVWQKR